MQKRQLEVEVL